MFENCPALGLAHLLPPRHDGVLMILQRILQGGSGNSGVFDETGQQRANFIVIERAGEVRSWRKSLGLIFELDLTFDARTFWSVHAMTCTTCGDSRARVHRKTVVVMR